MTWAPAMPLLLGVALVLLASMAPAAQPDVPVASLAPGPATPPGPSSLPDPPVTAALPAQPWQGGLRPYVVLSQGQEAAGLVAFPDQPTDTLVVLAHGWGGNSSLHRDDLLALAQAGFVAVAMDFRGPQGDFKLTTGVQDTLAATFDLQRQYPSIHRVVLYGWSMGGAVALLAAAQGPPGTYDAAYIGSGVTDLAAVWNATPFVRLAVEAEAGGTPSEAAPAYVRLSPVAQAEPIARHGLERVVFVHGVADEVVPLDHATRMAAALHDAGVPVSLYVVTKDADPVCFASGCIEHTAQGGHFAGRLGLVMPFLASPGTDDDTSVLATYDGSTGLRAPVDGPLTAAAVGWAPHATP